MQQLQLVERSLWYRLRLFSVSAAADTAKCICLHCRNVAAATAIEWLSDNVVMYIKQCKYSDRSDLMPADDRRHRYVGLNIVFMCERDRLIGDRIQYERPTLGLGDRYAHRPVNRHYFGELHALLY